jgi:hypothetical protein
MARTTEQDLYLHLARHYLIAVEGGYDQMALPVELIADALEYLDSGNSDQRRITTQLDDQDEPFNNEAGV